MTTTMNPPPFNHHPWFSDIGTTNYFTTDLNNLNVDSLSYRGPNQVSIVDGSSLPIPHIRAAHLHSP